MLGAKAEQRALQLDEVHRRLTQEGRDKRVHRVFIDLLRRPHLTNLPPIHHDDPIAQPHRLHLIVRDVDDRALHLSLEPLQLVARHVAQLGVQVRERLVEQEYLRIAYQGAAQRHALPLAARQLPRIAIQVARDAEHIGRPADLLRDRGTGLASRLEGERNVASDGAVGVQRVTLEDHRDPAGAGWGVVHALAADQNLSRRRPLQPRDHAKQRGLAAPRRAEQHEELTLANREVHVVDRIELPESFAEVTNLDAGHRLWALPGRGS